MDSPSPRRYQDKTRHHHHHYHNSPNSSTSSNNSNGLHQQMPPPPPTPTSLGPGIPAPPAYYPQRNLGRSESGSPYPTTFVQADSSSFKQVVQMLTGCTETARQASSAYNTVVKDQHSSKNSHHHIPPMKTIPNKKHQHQHQQQSSGFKLYERRNNISLNPLLPAVSSKNIINNSSNNVAGVGSPRFSPRNHHEVLSPSILDFPSLVLSPVTPLIPDPFGRSSAAATPNAAGFNHGNGNGGAHPILDTEAEERAIKEKGFFLHPSPASTPRDTEPRLLPLFPTASPRASAAGSSSSA